MQVPVRRIVTHNDAEGLSYALIDGVATNKLGILTELWTTQPAPHDHKGTVDAGALSKSLEPPKNGTVFRFFQIAPQSSTAHLTREQKEQAWRDLFASVNAHGVQPNTSRDPGMHTSATTDYIVLLSGQITLLLDKGEHTLKPFDVVIQRGTNHAWVNRGEEPALLMAVLVDAKGE